MIFQRSPERIAPLIRLVRIAPLVLLSSALTLSSAAIAQTQQPAPASPAAIPAATPAAPSSLPSLPAATPATDKPSPTSSTTYHDPLEAPLQIPTTPATPQTTFPAVPAAIPAPQNSLPATTEPVAAKPNSLPSVPPYDPQYASHNTRDTLGSTYIPVDSPIYPMALRLYGMGYLSTAFIDMRPWTRRSLLHALEVTSDEVVFDGNDQAAAIVARLKSYLADEVAPTGYSRGQIYGLETAYTRLMGINGQTLRDSYHLGQTLVNDYGRPYEPGFNNITGFSSVNEMGPFSLYVRGEYEHSPSGPGYSLTLANQLSCIDTVCPFAPPNDPQATIPYGTQLAVNPFRLQEAALSFHVLGHEISGGKTDSWNSSAFGGSMLLSNNAEDIYSFRINRVEPLHIPLLSAILGPVRYDFVVGSLKGHTAPNSPWIHSEVISFRPASDFEFAFERSAIWGGHGHEPVTLHTFLKSFFSFGDTEGDPAVKGSPQDPGDRLSDFTFSWRLPFLNHWLTLYADTICHDDVTPLSAPRRAAYRPGVYLSHVPGLPKLDFRIEGASTDSSTLRSLYGSFLYYEGVQRQGYTNKGFLMGDWMGREAKGGQAWLTWHMSPDEHIQVEYLTKETAKDFIAGGVTQSDFKVDVIKHIHHDLELNAWAQFERWKAPVPLAQGNNPLVILGGPLYLPNAQRDTVIAAQLTWYPKLHALPKLNGK